MKSGSVVQQGINNLERCLIFEGDGLLYFSNTIAIASLVKPTGPRPLQYKYDDEDKYYEAYKARLIVARSLGSSGLYFDGIHYLNIASECFLKYLFCLVRHEIFQVRTPSNIDNSIPYDYDTAFLFPKNKLTAKDFSHNHNSLVKFLSKFSDVYTAHPEFKKYIRNLKKDETWINTRYESVVQSDYQIEFADYLADFDNVLNGCFARIK